MNIITRRPFQSLLLFLRYSHARSISSTPHHLQSVGWIDKIKGVFTGKTQDSAPPSTSLSLLDFADQMDKAKALGKLKSFTVGSDSFQKQALILRYLGSIDSTGENLKSSHKQDATTHCGCTISEVESALSKYAWAKEAQKKIYKLKEEGKPMPTTVAEVEKLMDSTPLDVRRSNLAKSGKLGRNALCSCGSGKKFKRCCGPP